MCISSSMNYKWVLHSKFQKIPEGEFVLMCHLKVNTDVRGSLYCMVYPGLKPETTWQLLNFGSFSIKEENV